MSWRETDVSRLNSHRSQSAAAGLAVPLVQKFLPAVLNREDLSSIVWAIGIPLTIGNSAEIVQSRGAISNREDLFAGSGVRIAPPLSNGSNGGR